MSSHALALRIDGVSKTFGSNRVLNGVSMEVKRGEIHALVGQNGSGKSTLIKILTGFHQPDQTRPAILGGADVLLGEMTSAEHHRIRVVHQDLALIPSLTAVENLALTAQGSFGRLRLVQERQRTRALLESFGASFDVDLPVEKLRPFERATIAIARALGDVEGVDLLILDEPTAAIGAVEVDHLFEVLRSLKARGLGIIYVSHILEEIRRIADRVSVLRDGTLVETRDVQAISEREIIRAMLGEDVEAPHRIDSSTGSEAPLLSIRDLTAPNVEQVSLDVRRGEVVGLAGLLGAGCDDLLATVFGANQPWSGTIRLDGEALRLQHPTDAIDRGIAMMPADRTRLGLLVEQSLAENITLPSLSSVFLRGRISGRHEATQSRSWLTSLQVNTTDPTREVRSLSGGNQQKVMLAKWLRTQPKVLLLHEPTQAVDVGAKAAIERIILDRAREGTAVLIASTEADDLARLCDRVVVMRAGRVVTELEGADLTEHRILEAIHDTVDADQRS